MILPTKWGDAPGGFRLWEAELSFSFWITFWHVWGCEMSIHKIDSTLVGGNICPRKDVPLGKLPYYILHWEEHRKSVLHLSWEEKGHVSLANLPTASVQAVLGMRSCIPSCQSHLSTAGACPCPCRAATHQLQSLHLPHPLLPTPPREVMPDGELQPPCQAGLLHPTLQPQHLFLSSWNSASLFTSLNPSQSPVFCPTLGRDGKDERGLPHHLVCFPSFAALSFSSVTQTKKFLISPPSLHLPCHTCIYPLWSSALLLLLLCHAPLLLTFVWFLH